MQINLNALWAVLIIIIILLLKRKVPYYVELGYFIHVFRRQ